MNKIATVSGFFEESKAPQITFDGEENPAEKEYPYLSNYSPELGDKVFCLEFGESYIIIGKINFQEEPFMIEDFVENSLQSTKTEVENLKTKHDTDLTALQTSLEETNTVLDAVQTTANSAKTTGDNAYNLANTAKNTANNALSTANTANNTSNTAKNRADSAYSKAETAISNASDANRVAQTAKTDAGLAKNRADSAYTLADNAYKKTSFSTFTASGPIGFFGHSTSSKRSVATLSTSTTQINQVVSKLNDVINALKSYGLL